MSNKIQEVAESKIIEYINLGEIENAEKVAKFLRDWVVGQVVYLPQDEDPAIVQTTTMHQGLRPMNWTVD